MSVTGLPPPRISREFRRLSRPLPKTTYELLVDMGFSQKLSEKVIAAVGDKDIHVAVDWLMSHLEDPTLKEDTPRDYFVYLCPTGDLHKCLMDFWEKTENECGWNGIHSHFPHITLCPIFKVADDKISKVVDIFSSLKTQQNCSAGKLTLERYSVNNFIGLFVPNQFHTYLESIMSEFAGKLAKHGITLEPHKTQLHLTLAYHFPQSQFDALNTLSQEIHTDLDVGWDLRLYSRDHRLAQSQVYRVLTSFTARSDAELDLIEGDYMFVETGDSSDNSDGWFYGTSWLTGCSGLFPSLFCKRCAEMLTWTLHKSISLEPHSPTNSAPHYGESVTTDISSLYSKVKRRKSYPMLPPRQPSGPRRINILRHGERVDFVLGRDWACCFDRSGNYTQSDLNLPRQLPRRRENITYVADSPLTEIGLFQAYKTGEALADSRVGITRIYSSPSFRCIQTATEVVRGMKTDILINVDAALFEWLQWYPTGLPGWLSMEELLAYSYPVNTAYKPFYSRKKLESCMNETIPQYYQRSHDFVRHILSDAKKPGENILLVGHAATLDVCMRRMRGFECRQPREFQEFVSKIPYCAFVTHEENICNKTWSIKDSPILSLTHASNRGMYWRSEVPL